MSHTILRLPIVKSRTGLSRSTLYLLMSEGKFPKPLPLGTRAVGWLESDVQDWVEHRIKARNGSDQCGK